MASTASVPKGEPSDGWAGTPDAIQLSKLSGVLNVFDRNASFTFQHVKRIATAVRNQDYGVSSQILGKKLVHEMLVKR
jgi:hypothetical protein